MKQIDEEKLESDLGYRFGYVTEFILISGGPVASTTPEFYNDSGAPADFSH